jgi:hypothetical protein
MGFYVDSRRMRGRKKESIFSKDGIFNLQFYLLSASFFFTQLLSFDSAQDGLLNQNHLLRFRKITRRSSGLTGC